ncbi:MAG: hypothetical protein SXG53_10150 [Pseudomonadota bacterium]|nr:hypothetical protein [Pseudomonadota bacterium]
MSPLYAAKRRGRDCIVIMEQECGDLTTGAFRKKAAGAGVTH